MASGDVAQPHLLAGQSAAPAWPGCGVLFVTGVCWWSCGEALCKIATLGLQSRFVLGWSSQATLGDGGAVGREAFAQAEQGGEVRPNFRPSVDSATMRGFYPRVGKRAFDLVTASFLVLLLSPVYLGVWLVLMRAVGRGVLLAQPRVGRRGKTYACLKFRTMNHCRRQDNRSILGPDRRQTHKSDHDPRHTRVGRMLRKYSLDELPQLLNVIRGEMSLVGPRPEMASRATESFLAHRRHLVRPGLTGPFQLSEHRQSGNLAAGLELDEWYVEQASFRTDVRLLLSTARAVITGTGS